MNSWVKAKETDLLSMEWRVTWYVLGIALGIMFFLPIFSYSSYSFYSFLLDSVLPLFILTLNDNNSFISTLGFFTFFFPNGSCKLDHKKLGYD